MKKAVWMVLGLVAAACIVSCNDGMSSLSDRGGGKPDKRDRSQRTVIDNTGYVDFSTPQYDAGKVKKEDVINFLGGYTFKNGNSLIKIKAMECTIELASDCGRYNGKDNCQVYGVFAFDVKAASGDCLYLRRDASKEGFVMIDGIMFRNDAIPDLSACLPLYGYSRNRIEVSSIMDGYIVMPSGTYWKQ